MIKDVDDKIKIKFTFQIMEGYDSKFELNKMDVQFMDLYDIDLAFQVLQEYCEEHPLILEYENKEEILEAAYKEVYNFLSKYKMK